MPAAGENHAAYLVQNMNCKAPPRVTHASPAPHAGAKYTVAGITLVTHEFQFHGDRIVDGCTTPHPRRTSLPRPLPLCSRGRGHSFFMGSADGFAACRRRHSCAGSCEYPLCNLAPVFRQTLAHIPEHKPRRMPRSRFPDTHTIHICV